MFEFGKSRALLSLRKSSLTGLTYIGDKMIADIVLKTDIAKWTTMVERISGIGDAIRLFMDVQHAHSKMTG